MNRDKNEEKKFSPPVKPGGKAKSNKTIPDGQPLIFRPGSMANHLFGQCY